MMARRGNTDSAGSLLTVAWMMSESSVELRMLVTRLTLPAWSAWDTDLARLSGSAQGTGLSHNILSLSSSTHLLTSRYSQWTLLTVKLIFAPQWTSLLPHHYSLDHQLGRTLLKSFSFCWIFPLLLVRSLQDTSTNLLIEG